jgi:hypothetical protein
MEITMKARREIYAQCAPRYRASGKKGKGLILDEVEELTGGNRDYLSTMLKNYGRAVYGEVAGRGVKYVARLARKGEKRSGRPKKYTAEFVETLKAIWKDYGRQCGVRMVANIREEIDFLCAESKYKITPKIRSLLTEISASHFDRLMAAGKDAAVRGISTTPRGKKTPLRARIAVCTHMDRVETAPGYFGIDTVAHCGADGSGHFCKTYSLTDAYSGWYEARPLLNSAKKWINEANADIKADLPFPWLGALGDGEFVSESIFNWFLSEKIRQTRTRPYHSNDNCLVEQKNYDACRKAVGYVRLDTKAEWEALGKVYVYLCPLYNYWFHSMKLIGREKKQNKRWKKIYEKPLMTPYERLMEAPDEQVSPESKAELRRRKSLQNPVELNKNLNRAIDRLLQINREKENMEKQQNRPPRPVFA